jgi:hypothetical protein
VRASLARDRIDVGQTLRPRQLQSQESRHDELAHVFGSVVFQRDFVAPRRSPRVAMLVARCSTSYRRDPPRARAAIHLAPAPDPARGWIRIPPPRPLRDPLVTIPPRGGSALERR